MTAKKRTQKPLSTSRVFVRVRPEVHDGGGHDQDGEAVAKGLEGWSDKSVTLSTAYMFSTGSSTYTFPRHVFGPECSQEDVYAGAAAAAVQSFTEWEGRDVMLLAYGQTGTGKTTTIFGFERALASGDEAGWGIFPRVCADTLARLRAEGGPFLLTVSALEFYLMSCTDLLGGKRAVHVDEEHRFVGHTRRRINEVADVLPAIETVGQARTTRATRMNSADGEHAGSSRSHCALQLTLARVRGGRVCETTFTLIDLAGAERPGKVREVAAQGEVGSAEYAIWQAERSGAAIPDSLEMQTIMINYELFLIGKEVLLATEAHRRGRVYAAPRQSTTPFIKFLGGCLDGSCETSMVVTLSQAPQNGWETWFSLQYGSDLAKLACPVQKQRSRNIGKELVAAEARAREAAAAIAGGPPSAPGAAKYWPAKLVAAQVADARVEWLRELAALALSE